MLPALDERERVAAFRVGVLTTLAACALAPLSGASSVPREPTRIPGTFAADRRPLPPLRIPAFRATRDPFQPQAADVPANSLTRAVVFGREPRAIVDLGGKEMLVEVGDAIAGMRVSSIDDNGVVLSDGTRIPLRSGQP
jgi:hypothetical protein